MQHLSLSTPKNELNDLQVALVAVLGVGCPKDLGSTQTWAAPRFWNRLRVKLRIFGDCGGFPAVFGWAMTRQPSGVLPKTA
jgi:hypothetical protein